MTVKLLPSSEMVMAAWILSIPGLTLDGAGEQLPADETEWSTNGYVTVAVAGGTPLQSVSFVTAVMQVDCWATIPSSPLLPWLKANSIAEQIRLACASNPAASRAVQPVAIGADGTTVQYPVCSVRSAIAQTIPHRIYSDIGDYAGYSLDVIINWSSSAS